MWPAILAALASTVASYGLSKLGGGGDSPRMPKMGEDLRQGSIEPPAIMPTQAIPLQFGQQGNGVNPYNMPNLGVATQKALGRYMGR